MLLVLLSVWISDIFLNKLLMGHFVIFYPGFYWQYGSYMLITLIGALFKHQNNIKHLSLVLASVASSSVFFLLSNLGVWYSGWLYSPTLEGLFTCYVAALPFFKHTLLSDLFFTLLLFGSLKLLNMRFFFTKMASITHIG